MSLMSQLESLRRSARDFSQAAEPDRILALISSGNPYAELFFSEIEDPAWIPKLELIGLFHEVPEPIRHDDGSTSYPRSPALHGLTRLAPKAPEAAARIVAEISPSENIVVGDQLMRCMLAIRAPEQTPRLLPIAQDLVRTGGRSTRLFLRELLKSWVELGRTEEALELLSTFIDTIVRAEPTLRRDQQTAWELAECDRDVLAPLTLSDPGRVATVCFGGLCAYYDASHPRSQKPDQDFDVFLDATMDDPRELTFWLEDFRQTGLRPGDPGVILAHRLYSALIPIYSDDPMERDKQDSALGGHPWDLYTRLRCQVYADVPKQTLALARREVFANLANMNRADCRHGFEFASMLESHTICHGRRFLSEEERESIVLKVLEGPLNEAGELDPDENYRRYFWRQQLWPIRSLLSDEMRQQLDRWAETDSGRRKDPELEDYKPFRSYGRSGSVQDRSPYTVDELADLPDAELWQTLNYWRKSKDWIEDDDLVEESSRKLAGTFTNLVATKPDRFPASSKWWENLQRPVMLSVPLETWAKGIGPREDDTPNPPTSVDPVLAFGMMDYVVSVSQDRHRQEGASEDSPENPDWWQARLATAHFLKAYVRANPPENEQSTAVKSLLRDLITGAEERLDRLNRSKHHDWQFEAINSVRGEAWGAVLHLALKEKNHPQQAAGAVSAWIPDLLAERLNPEVSESPAIYSLLGSQLRILAYVAPAWVREHKALLFPGERPECLEAITAGHLAYDQPHKLVAEVAPEFFTIALDVAERRSKSDREVDSGDSARDVSSRLGFHIVFYFWNNWFADHQTGERLFDRFLSIAPSRARAETLSYIGSAFKKAVAAPEVQPLIDRARSMLDRWLQWIQQEVADQNVDLDTLDAELGQFADLIATECFPFDWRVAVALKSLSLVTRPRWSFQLLDTLEEWSEQEQAQPERIGAGIQLLAAITSKLSDELRWSIQVKRLTPVLKAGLKHDDDTVRRQTNEVIENLLRHGFFELLDLNSSEA